jgi:hypothetical protein
VADDVDDTEVDVAVAGAELAVDVELGTDAVLESAGLSESSEQPVSAAPSSSAAPNVAAAVRLMSFLGSGLVGSVCTGDVRWQDCPQTTFWRIIIRQDERESMRSWTTTVSVTDDDLTAQPMNYPGRSVAGSGVLYRGEFLGRSQISGIDRVLHDLGQPGLARRHPVVAVGSNACAAVMRRKLEAVGVDACVPFLDGEVDTIAVGHSAHRSVAGFVPAAPFRREGSPSHAVVTMLTADQLVAVDRTEPNYRRATVRCDLGELGIVSADVYVSLWGVIAPPGQPPMPLMTQRELQNELRSRCADFAHTEPPSATMTLAAVLAEGGWVAEAGL